MGETQSQQLRKAVKARLIPYILSCGFQEDKREMWKQDPYGHQTKRFLRNNDHNLELIEIQFDKHGRGAFVINFGIAPPEGVVTYGMHRTQAQTAIMDLHQQARLYAGKAWRMRWFGFPWIKIPILRNPTADQIVGKAIRRFSQIETWFKEGIIGPNVKINRRSHS